MTRDSGMETSLPNPSSQADRTTAASSGERATLAPLDTAGVLWVAAIDRVPIEERVEWVKSMEKQVEGINAMRAKTLVDPTPLGGLRDWNF